MESSQRQKNIDEKSDKQEAKRMVAVIQFHCFISSPHFDEMAII
jgi:hypothetical protein